MPLDFRAKFILACLIGLSPPPSVFGQDLLEEVRGGNQATLQSIHTLHCRVKITIDPTDSAPSFSGEYWRSDDRSRTKSTSSKGVTDTIVEGSILRSHYTRKFNGKTHIGGIVQQSSSMMIGDCDAWALAGFTLAGPEPATGLSLDELLKKPHQINHIAKKTEDGQEYVALRIEHALSKQDLWINPKLNYLVEKLVLSYPPTPTPDTTSGKTEMVLKNIKEAAPGIYFPGAVESRHFQEGKLRYTRLVTFSEIQINKPLDSSAFAFRFPAGITVRDMIQGKEFKVDEAGKLIGPGKDLATGQPLPGGSPVRVPRTETKEEPTSWTHWILPFSIGALVIALLVRYRQHFQRKPSAAS